MKKLRKLAICGSKEALINGFELPRPVRGRGFLLHGLVLSHESRITVLSPQFLRFTNVSSIKSINPSF